MQACKDPRERIKSVFADVKEAGINTAAFREVAREHREERAQERRLAKLDLADKADFDVMSEALGMLADTELGKAALAKTKRPDEEALDNLGA